MQEPSGLNDIDAANARSKVGANVAALADRPTLILQLLHQFNSPLVIILIIAALVSGALGDWTSGILILCIVFISAALDFAQTYHSQQAADRLRRQVAPTARVKRSGVWRDIAPEELAPGDLIRLQAGDLVPADAYVISSESLFVQQSALTGESVAVEKKSVEAPPATPPDPDDSCRVFLGTSVTSGSALAIIETIGAKTAFGQIGTSLRVRRPETEFERGMRELSLLVTRAVVFLAFFVLLVSIVMHRDPFQSLLFAVALAVGLTPEFLPMINTITLGAGAVRMSRKKVIVKRLQAIENLGGMDILCSDKTGTLTREEMKLEAALDSHGENPSPYTMALARLNSRFENGIRNTLDDAILAAPLADGEPDYTKARRLGEIPFDFERRRLSVFAATPGLPDQKEGAERFLLITKGAPESVLAICAYIRDAQGSVTPLDDTTREICNQAYQKSNEQGYRVLAVAYRELTAEANPDAGQETQMVLAGFLTLANPPLPDAARMIQKLQEDGVQIKILTGDNELVTAHLCNAIGLAGLKGSEIIMGDQIAHMSDSALGQVAEEANIFARVSPVQKNRIILALKRRGHVVGYIGDGINDAPSLHSADVGISVANGADVARDAAEIILLERSLAVLHDGITEGRRAYGNVLKYLLMNLSSNFGNMVSMAGAAAFLPFLPMLPTQILLNNLLYDLSQVTIPTDNVDDAILRRPRRWDMRLIRDFMLYIGPISSLYDFLTFWALRVVFHASEKEFHTGWFVESLATQTLVIFVIRTSSRFWEGRPSAPLLITMFVTVCVAVILPYSPLARPLGFVPLPLSFLGFVLAITVTYLAVVELIKRRLLSRFAM